MKRSILAIILSLGLAGAAFADTAMLKRPPELTGYGLALKDFKKLLELVDNKARPTSKHSYVSVTSFRFDHLDPLVPGRVRGSSQIKFKIAGSMNRPGRCLPRSVVPRPIRVAKQFGWLKTIVHQNGVWMSAKITPRYVFLDSKGERVGLAGAMITYVKANGDLFHAYPVPSGDKLPVRLRPLIQRVLRASLKFLNR